MKKLLFLLFGLLVFALPQSVTAASEHIEDNAGLFSATEISELESQAVSLSDTIKGDVYLVTSADNSEDPEEFAQEYSVSYTHLTLPTTSRV